MRAVFFDAGNTLLLPHPSVAEVCRAVLATRGHDVDADRIDAQLHLAEDIYERAYEADDTFWMHEERASGLWCEMYASVLRQLGLDGAAEELGRAIYEEFGNARCWATYPDVVPGLKRLKDLGLVLGMISNWDSRLPDLCHGLGLSGYFDFVISSANLGLHKPNPRIFELALERAHVAAPEACHVGDHYYADVLGARAAGLTPILINRTGDPIAADCAVVSDLEDLARRLEADVGL